MNDKHHDTPRRPLGLLCGADRNSAVDIPRYAPKDPYRPLEPGARRVDYYEPSYVRGAQ